jgi:hypothetical protein
MPNCGLVAGKMARQVGWDGRAGMPLEDQFACPETDERYCVGRDNLMQIVAAP